MEHLFISYSRRDEKYVTAVAENLRSRGIEVWQDVSGKASGIPYSTKWFEVIQEALFSSAGAVIFASEAWKKSNPCKKEFELIKALDIPYKEVEVPPAGTGQSPEGAAEMIAHWSEKDVYGDADNMDRVWMLSMVWTQRTKYGELAGIPRFRKRKEAKQFLDRLEKCRIISEQRGFPERLAKCRRIVTDGDDAKQEQTSGQSLGQALGQQLSQPSGQSLSQTLGQPLEKSDEIERFLKKARRTTTADLIKRPLAVVIILLLIAGSAAVNWIYSVQRDQAQQHLEALTIMETVRNLIDEDEEKALSLMGQENLEFGEYVTLLYEAYAQVLSRESPAKICAAGTEEAKKIGALPEQTNLKGYTVELSETSGIVRVYTDVWEDEARRMIALSVSDSPDDWAVQDGYLAIAAGKHAYVYDLTRGTAAVQLYGCDGEIQKIRFDESGRICAVTDSGEICIWENPISRMICSIEELPQQPDDSIQAEEHLAKNGAIRLTCTADGMIRAYDTSRDCLIWQCTSVTEPITNLLWQEDTWTVYAQGRSGTWYKADASDVLAEYDSKDVTGQRERYKKLKY